MKQHVIIFNETKRNNDNAKTLSKKLIKKKIENGLKRNNVINGHPKIIKRRWLFSIRFLRKPFANFA